MFTYAAYNAAPADLAANAGVERDWYGILRAETLIGGLELGFLHGLHPHGVARLTALLDRSWRNIVTTMPHTLASVADDRVYGLASTDPDGRRRAVDDVRALREDVLALRAALGAHAVIAAELQSAPLAVSGAASLESLTESLVEIAGWGWDGVALILEHSDAATDAHAPAKGWLPLDDEIDAVAAVAARTGIRIGQAVNWGRSVIETHTPKGAVAHLERLRATGTLAGFTVSGVSGSPTSRSLPWEDVHLAVDDIDPESLLTRDALDEAVAVAKRAPLRHVGVKVGAPAVAESLRHRLEPGFGTLRALHDSWSRADAAL